MASVRRLSLVVLMALMSPAMTSVAHASHVGCGDTITASTTLDSDVGPCSGDGIVVGADNITLNLGGHQILGSDNPNDAGVGVRVAGHHGVTVTNGSITKFDAGVAIANGWANTVSSINAYDNFPPLGTLGGDNGEGVSITGPTADNNSVLNSRLTNNGPYGGISVYGGTSADKITGTVLSGNTLVDNNNGGSNEHGVRIENWTWNATISNNSVTGSGNHGIALFADTRFDTVSGNDVRRNASDGIHAFARSGNHTIQNNQVFDNPGNGIFIAGPISGGNPVTGTTTVAGSTSNSILTNNTGRNAPTASVHQDPVLGIGPVGATVVIRVRGSVNDTTVEVPTRSSYDLQDGNPGCDANVWSANTYQTAFPDCTKA